MHSHATMPHPLDLMDYDAVVAALAAVDAHHGFVISGRAGAAGGTKFTVVLPRLGDGPKKTPKATARSRA